MKFTPLFSILCLIALVYGHTHHNHDHIGFFWDNFDRNKLIKGVIGGKDIHNNDVYIGQTKHVEGNTELLIPGTIYATNDEASMVYEWDKTAHKATGDFQMLYTDYPAHMVWVPTNSNNVKQLLTEKELIFAGHDEKNNKFYIGRIQMDGNYLLGKIVIGNKDIGFHALSKSGYIHTNEFEVLTHEMK